MRNGGGDAVLSTASSAHARQFVSVSLVMTLLILTMSAPSDAEIVGSGTADDPFTELDVSVMEKSLMELYEENGTSTFYFVTGAYVNIGPNNIYTYTLENFGWIDQDFVEAGGLTREYDLMAGRDTGIITGNIQDSMSFDFIYFAGGSVLTFEFLIADEPMSPFIATTGSGTEDDPYSGVLTTTENLSGADYIPSEIWVEAGTEFDVIIFEDGGGMASNFTLSEGFGLILNVSKYEGTVTGTANISGDCVLTDWSMINESDPLWTVTFHIVQTYPELVFDSDPVSDGTIAFTGS